ncbi:hypothetical protein PSCICN_04310 [Pseudomonas cichorii]|nr:hypothetical protein PSCICN_04310 [Pseudomonas cichorii]
MGWFAAKSALLQANADQLRCKQNLWEAACWRKGLKPADILRLYAEVASKLPPTK